jgi:hypothetical protein
VPSRDGSPKYPQTPPGFVEGGATAADLAAAGFLRRGEPPGKPGQPATAAPQTRYQVQRDPAGGLRQVLYKALRDPDNRIVASWGSGRWWTPDEFNRHYAAEAPPLQPNRAARRNKRER